MHALTKPITVILGPTAIGKSDYAIALAKENNGIIISADAYQIYKGMDIGTAKVLRSDQQNVPHYLIDIKTPDETYSVYEFIEETKKIIASHSPQTPILICGGTGFYLYSFLYEFEFDASLSQNPEIRDQIEQDIKHHGLDAMWQKLIDFDPILETSIPPQNTHRIIRGLELIQLTGKRPSELKTAPTHPRKDTEVIGLIEDRTVIYDRINTRVETMINAGLIEEVEQLLKHYDPDCPSFNAIGYKEIIHYILDKPLHNRHGHPFTINDKKEMIELIKIHTRRFAKRQLTWFKRFTDANWIKKTL